jgi:signal transduction histidine kinase
MAEKLLIESPEFLVDQVEHHCYVVPMNKNPIKTFRWSFEQLSLLVLALAFVVAISSSWISAMNLRETISANAVVNVDVTALVEVEKLRNIAESQIADGRSFFLLGSKALFDKQKKDKQTFTDSLASFEKQYKLPQIPEIIKRLDSIQQQHQEIFDQTMELRGKQTDERAVAQSYQSKTAPLRLQLNESLDEIAKLYNAELERTRGHAREAAANAEVQIPRGMTWLTAIMGILFLGMTLLVIRMLRERTRQIAERTRLFNEAKKAIQARDEIVAAISQDLIEPLSMITEAVETQDGEVIKSSVSMIQQLIKDIVDQTKMDMGGLTLRLDQLSLDVILEDARLMMQPIAKKRDVRLQFESVNPPVLAFFDYERVMRVFSNLIGNAIKFSPKHNKVVVKVRSDQQFVYISVSDSGPGIPENKLAGIFDNFWQARKTAEQGAGVGLAIVKTIIEAHGGTVRVDSHSTHGTTFTFSLPRRRPVGAHLKKPATAVRQTPRQVEV